MMFSFHGWSIGNKHDAHYPSAENQTGTSWNLIQSMKKFNKQDAQFAH